MWIKAENSRPVKPLAKETLGNGVILRKDFKFVEETKERGAHWEYNEWQMTADQYAVYEEFERQINEQSDALIELAELAAEQDDALTELAGLIEDQQKGAEKWQKSTITASKQVL